MNACAIDEATFRELQDTAGADFVVELVEAFFQEAPQMLDELRAALAAADADAFRRSAHSLKSNSLTFGALALGAQARELELGGLPADGSGVDALAAHYGVVAAELKALCHG